MAKQDEEGERKMTTQVVATRRLRIAKIEIVVNSMLHANLWAHTHHLVYTRGVLTT